LSARSNKNKDKKVIFKDLPENRVVTGEDGKKKTIIEIRGSPI